MTDLAPRPRATPKPSAPDVGWLSDLIRLEIALWDRIDARLRAEHDIPLAHFESLWFLSHAPGGALRIGELASALRVTVGGTSKIADRIAAAGLIRRQPDPADRRVSMVVLTAKGKRKHAAAQQTYEAELDDALANLDRSEQQQMHGMIRRLLDAQSQRDG